MARAISNAAPTIKMEVATALISIRIAAWKAHFHDSLEGASGDGREDSNLRMAESKSARLA
jgi:hypothetical protein